MPDNARANCWKCSGPADGWSDVTIDNAAGNSALRQASVPVVLLDRDVDFDCDRVSVDHRQGAYEAVSHLISLGHRSIRLETPSDLIRPGRERIAGATAAVEHAGLPLSTLQIGDRSDLSQERVYSNVLHELSKPSRPTAVIALGNEMLASVLSAIATAVLSSSRHYLRRGARRLGARVDVNFANPYAPREGEADDGLGEGR